MAKVEVSGGELVLAAKGRPALEKLNRLEINGGVVKIRESEQISESAAVVISSGGLMFDPSVTGRVERVMSLVNVNGVLSTGANTLQGIGSTIQWLGGTNRIDTGGRISDHHWAISGGLNTVKAGGVLTVEAKKSAPSGVELIAARDPLIRLEASDATPGVLELLNDVVVRPLEGSRFGAKIVSEGAGTKAGVLRLAGTRTFTVEAGTYAGLSISADIEDLAGGVAGAMVKRGGGKLELSGIGRFTGGVTLNEGTLVLSDDRALGTGTLTVEGTGLRVKSGAGALKLANAVDLKSDLVMGSLGGPAMTFGGETRLNGRRTLTVDSAVSLNALVDGAAEGSALVKRGAGEMTMTGVNSYGGETVIDAGRLVLAAGAGLVNTSKITVAEGASIDLGNYTFKQKVLLTGPGLFDGNPVLGAEGQTVALNPGRLTPAMALGQFADRSSAVTRFGNVVFEGRRNGIELSNVVTVGFNVRSESADQVSVDGEVTFRTTGVTPASVASVDVNDVVQFRALPEVRVSTVGRTIIPKAILKAQVVRGMDGSGRLLQVVSDERRLENSSSAVLSYRVKYEGNNEFRLIADRASYADLAASANSAALGRYLDKQVAFDGGDGTIKLSDAVKASGRATRYDEARYNDDLLALLDDLGTAARVAAVLAQLDGSAYAELNQVARKRLIDLANPIDQRLNALAMFGSRTKGTDSGIGTGVERWSLWNASYGTQTQRDGDMSVGFHGYRNSSQGSVMGIELPTNGFRSGLLASSSTDRFNFAMPSTSVRTDAWHVGLYSATATEPWFADAMMLYGRTDSTSSRQVQLGNGVSKTARARFDGDEMMVQLGIGAQMAPVESKWEITPTARLMLSSASTSPINETGAEGISLIGSGRRTTAITSKVGIGLSKSGSYRGMRTVFRARADWFRDHSGLQSQFSGRLAGAPDGSLLFTNRSAAALRDAFLFSASMEIGFTERLSLRLSGQYELRSTMRTLSGNVSIGVEF
jgi:autotransporter-associated beta strand protein